MAKALVLLMWPLLFLECAVATAAVVTSSSSTWKRIPLETGGVIVVDCTAMVQMAPLWCKLTPVGPTMNADGKPLVLRATALPDGSCTCHVPAVDAAGVASLSLTHDNTTYVKSSVDIDFYATWSPSLGRRPYLSTATAAEFVVTTDPAAGPNLRITCPQLNLTAPIPTGSAATVSFSLESFPAQYEGWLSVTLVQDSNHATTQPLTRRLRLIRVLAPPSSLQSFTWLDYSRQAIA